MIKNLVLFLFAMMVGINVLNAANANSTSTTSEASNVADQIHAKNSQSSAGLSNPIDLNSANADELMTLHGVGQVKAKSILDYRQQNGPFKNVNDLTKVKGFSQNSVDKLEKNNSGRMVVK